MEMGGVIVYRCIHNKYRDYTKKFTGISIYTCTCTCIQPRLLILTHHMKGLSLSFQKITLIGPTELKLWLFHLTLHFESTRVGSVTTPRVLVQKFRIWNGP